MQPMDELINSIFADAQFAELRAFLAAFSAAIFFILIFEIILAILRIIGRWKVFKKAGEGGWKSLIPIYSDYISYKIAWAGTAFWIEVVLSLITCIFASMAYPAETFVENVRDFGQVIVYVQEPVNMVFAIIASVFAIIGLVWRLVFTYKTSKVFGHGFGFFLGLLFFPTIFTLILGFGSSEYKGIDYGDYE